jgi:hypothetical protein
VDPETAKLIAQLAPAGITGAVALVGALITASVARGVARDNQAAQRLLAAETERRERRARRVESLLDAAETLFTLASEAFSRHLDPNTVSDRRSPADQVGVPASGPLTILRVRGALDPEVDRLAKTFIDEWTRFVELDRQQSREDFVRAGYVAINALATAYARLVDAVEGYIGASSTVLTRQRRWWRRLLFG